MKIFVLVALGVIAVSTASPFGTLTGLTDVAKDVLTIPKQQGEVDSRVGNTNGSKNSDGGSSKDKSTSKDGVDGSKDASNTSDKADDGNSKGTSDRSNDAAKSTDDGSGFNSKGWNVLKELGLVNESSSKQTNKNVEAIGSLLSDKIKSMGDSDNIIKDFGIFSFLKKYANDDKLSGSLLDLLNEIPIYDA